MTAPSLAAQLLSPKHWRAKLRQTDPTLYKGAIRAFLINGVGLVLGLVTQTVLARTLGTRGYGMYIYVLGWANVAGLLCALEFANAAVRFISAYAATNDLRSLRGFVRKSHQIVGTTTVTVALVGAAVILMWRGMERETVFAFLAVCALFPLTSIIQLQGGILLGLKRVTQSQAPFQVMRPALFAIMVIVVARMVGTDHFNPPQAVGLQLVATAAALVATTWSLRKEVRGGLFGGDVLYHTGEWVRASVQFVAISIAQLVLSTQADLLIIGVLLTKTDTGLYGAASQLATLVGFGANAIMVIAQPMIADLYARGELANLRRVAIQIVRLTLLASAPVFVVVVAIGPTLLHLYGREFMAAYPVLVILASSQLFAAVIGMLLGYLFTMTAHQQVATRIIGASAALNIVLTLILTPRFGTMGTASATAVSTIARTVALLVASRRIFVPVAPPPASTPAA